MKKNTGRSSAFILSFATTLLLAAVLTLVLTSLYRMENTISPEGYTVLNIERESENKIKIVALNQNYFLDFNRTSENIDKLSAYDVLIPAEIRMFFCVVKSSIDTAGTWVKTLILDGSA